MCIRDSVQTSYNLFCAYTATFVGPPAFVSIYGSTLTVDESATSATDVTQHTITVNVASSLYPLTVTAKQYTFILDIQHCVVNTMTLPAITNEVYYLNDPTKVISFGPATLSDLTCTYAITYTAAYINTMALQFPSLLSSRRWHPDLCLGNCLLYTSPSPRDKRQYRMPSSA